LGQTGLWESNPEGEAVSELLEAQDGADILQAQSFDALNRGEHALEVCRSIAVGDPTPSGKLEELVTVVLLDQYTHQKRNRR
jgi:hypothetical protein